MKRKRFEGVTRFVDRHGKLRWRARAKGKTTKMLPGPFGSDEFVTAYDEWWGGAAQEIGADRTLPGTIAALIVEYIGSDEFLKAEDLSDSTRKAYRAALIRFKEKNGAKRITASLTRKTITDKLKAMAVEPSNMLLRCLRRLCAYAVDKNLLKEDPTIGMKKRRPARKSQGWHTWTVEEIAQYEKEHKFGTKARLALDLLLYLSQRKSDVVRFGRQHETQGGTVLKFRAKKTERTEADDMELPIVAPLRASIDASPTGDLAYLVTSFNKPFTANGFGNWFRARCDEAKLPQCSSHGLRKAMATRLADAGATPHQIQAITGHRSLSEVERYTRAADKRRLARQMSGIVADAKNVLDFGKPNLRFAKRKLKEER